MSDYAVDNIFFSCSETTQRSEEHFVPEHGLAHIYSGEIRVVDAGGEYGFTRGQSVLFSRNRLAKVTKHAEAGAPFRMVTILFKQDFLSGFYATHKPAAAPRKEVLMFGGNPLLDSLFQSLLPYEALAGPLPPELGRLKLSEAITIVRSIDPHADAILSDFSEPGKIDLADFMHRNFSFNIPLERFAYLTGRSLATFKRDFQKVFHTPPQKWLLERRLQEAHYLISEKKLRPSDAYIEVGFENLSHFSFAFKQQYGYNASELTR